MAGSGSNETPFTKSMFGSCKKTFRVRKLIGYLFLRTYLHCHTEEKEIKIPSTAGGNYRFYTIILGPTVRYFLIRIIHLVGPTE